MAQVALGIRSSVMRVSHGWLARGPDSMLLATPRSKRADLKAQLKLTHLVRSLGQVLPALGARTERSSVSARSVANPGSGRGIALRYSVKRVS